MKEFYDAIFKRKSFHMFMNVGSEQVSQEELEMIQSSYSTFTALYPDIKTGIRIVPSNSVNLKRDAEYCILIYSEQKENYLMNVGYIGEQLDLWLVEHNIGSLWYGIGKPDESQFNGMSFVIMFAIRKVTDESKFRKDMFKSKRKEISEIWKGENLGVADVCRFSPSACNTQPWYVENSNGNLTVFRYRKPGKRGIMPASAVAFYNRIDIGIFLCILDVCLQEKGFDYQKELYVDDGGNCEFTKVATYHQL